VHTEPRHVLHALEVAGFVPVHQSSGSTSPRSLVVQLSVPVLVPPPHGREQSPYVPCAGPDIRRTRAMHRTCTHRLFTCTRHQADRAERANAVDAPGARTPGSSSLRPDAGRLLRGSTTEHEADQQQQQHNASHHSMHNNSNTHELPNNKEGVGDSQNPRCQSEFCTVEVPI
jgi:hypothetical protein